MNAGDPLALFDLRNLDEHELLRAVIDAVPDAIFCKDRVGRYLMLNRACAAGIGMEPPSCIGQTVYDLPGLRENAAIYHADDMAVMTTGHPIVNREEPFVAGDGRQGWYLTSKYPLRNLQGEVVGLVGVARDISEMKRTSDELAQARQRLMDHVENSPLAVIEWQADFSVQRWLGQAEAIFGWSAEEVIGRPLHDWKFVFEEDAASANETCDQLLQGRALRNVCTQRNYTKDGRLLNCVWHNSVLRDAQGRIVSLLSLVEDVTERVRAEATARDSQRLYRSLIEATGTGYVVLDGDARVIEANTEYLRVTGAESLGEIRGRRVYEWTAATDLDRKERAVAACLKSGSIRNLEVEYASTDGRTVPVEINARLIETAGGRQIIALCRDISNRRAIERERQQIERKLLEAQRLESLAALAGGIGHDFNNLLTGVLGNASVAAAELPKDSPVLEFLEQIELSGSRAAELCKQLLAYSGKGRLVLRQVQLNTMTNEAVELVRLTIAGQATIRVDLGHGMPPILGDAAQMRQVIVNLLTNAAEALEGGAGAIRVRTGVTRADRKTFAAAHLTPDLPAGEYAFVEVHDDGKGIAPELRSRMFDPFFTTKFSSRGLGLASVFGIIRAHNGAVQVESEPGLGTTIRLLLPVDRTEPDPLPTAPPNAVNWRGHGTVLVIDDEVTIRRTATQMLRALGFEVQVAADGHEGIDLFLTNPDHFIAVLLDLTMPRLEGTAVLRSLRDLRPTVRVVLMSGYDEAEVVSRFANDRPSGFLQKPFRLPELREKLRTILA
jgi:two-component system cell cycle sensor histidine kinase/response regulator CckA